MAAFSSFVAAKTRPAPRAVLLPPNAFVEGWQGVDDEPWEKPSESVRVGLRTVSQDVLARARADAARAAWRRHPDEDDRESRIEAYNDALVGVALTSAVCSPDDATRPMWPVQQATIEGALTVEAQRHLWAELELLHLLESPTTPEATDEELHTLGKSLLDGSIWEGLDLAAARRVKRLLRHVLEEASVVDVEVE